MKIDAALKVTNLRDVPAIAQAAEAWNGMPREISDEMLEAFALIGKPNELPDKLIAKYAGLLDRVGLYAPFAPRQNDELWRALIAAVHAQ
jgi:hypothetical protein